MSSDLTKVLKELALEAQRSRIDRQKHTDILEKLEQNLSLRKVETETLTGVLKGISGMLANREELDTKALPEFILGVSGMFTELKIGINSINDQIMSGLHLSKEIRGVNRGKDIQFMSLAQEDFVKVISQIVAYSVDLAYDEIYVKFQQYLFEQAFREQSTMIEDLKNMRELDGRINVWNSCVNYLIETYQLDYVTESLLNGIYLIHLSTNIGQEPLKSPFMRTVLLSLQRARRVNRYCRECPRIELNTERATNGDDKVGGNKVEYEFDVLETENEELKTENID